MTLLAVERIKLFSTRSPWWCSALAIVLVTGPTALIAGTWSEDPLGPLPFAATGFFITFGMVVVMVMAAVAITSEYRYGTIRTTFQAIPNRPAALVAKTLVVSLVAGIVGLAAAFAAWGLARLLRPDADLALTGDARWRAVAGAGLVYLVAAVFAVAVGILLRQTAGAVSVLLVWVLLVESLVLFIPNVGDDIQKWLPFTAANRFLTDGLPPAAGLEDGPPLPLGAPLGPWASLAYAAALAVGLLAAAVAVAQRRDA